MGCLSMILKLESILRVIMIEYLLYGAIALIVLFMLIDVLGWQCMNLILNLIILLASWFIVFCLLFFVMLFVIIGVPVLVFLMIVGSVVRKLCVCC